MLGSSSPPPSSHPPAGGSRPGWKAPKGCASTRAPGGLDPRGGKSPPELKAFLLERLYRHPEVLRERRKAEAVLEGLFPPTPLP
ncbi:hypothetical protein [Thermus tengchongensis]|uniref:hypothetical protein n=1 Tax=Thermus tengchongensis TaxID=1214928 RepID=UPI0022A8E820|nr:hypothetical protein [Thermus tengchongensis]